MGAIQDQFNRIDFYYVLLDSVVTIKYRKKNFIFEVNRLC